MPDWATIAREKNREGVTLQLLWQEYRSVKPAGCSYRQLAENYGRGRMTLDPALRQEYRAEGDDRGRAYRADLCRGAVREPLHVCGSDVDSNCPIGWRRRCACSNIYAA